MGAGIWNFVVVRAGAYLLPVRMARFGVVMWSSPVALQAQAHLVE
jgi:hypothetical protein